MTNKNWCQDCWEKDNRQFVRAVGLYDGVLLCQPCMDTRKRQDAGGDDAKWTILLTRMAGLQPKQPMLLKPDVSNHKQYANQLRSMAAQSKIVADFIFTIETTPDGKVRVTKAGSRKKAPVVIDAGRAAKPPFDSNPFHGMHDQEKCYKVAELLRQGMKTIEAAQACGVNKALALAVGKRIANELPTNCRCGQKRGHTGRCKDQLAKSAGSPTPPQTLKVTHERHTTERQSVEMTNGHAPESEPEPEKSRLQEAMTDIFLPSGGALRLVFGGDMFAMSKEDREFVFEMVDRLKEYELRNDYLRDQAQLEKEKQTQP